MSLSHAKHAKHAKMTDGADSASMELALALMRSRDAIAGTEELVGQTASPVTLTAGDRLARMQPDHRSAVLIAELLEDLSLAVSATDPLTGAPTTATLSHRPAGTSVPLVAISRPDLDQFGAAVPLVGNYAELRADRCAEIDVQSRMLLPFFAAISPLQPDRSETITEMLQIGLTLTTHIVMRIKLALACPRPTQFSDRLQPMIACPSHPTLPSGHATQAFCVATLLTGLQNPATPVHAADQLYRLACRIAVNRTVAGVHFPADSAAGAVLGIQLARHLLARAKEKGTVARASFDGRQFVDKAQPRDFHYGVLDQMMTGHDRSTIFAGKAGPVTPAPLWASVVDRAQTEWDTRWS